MSRPSSSAGTFFVDQRYRTVALAGAIPVFLIFGIIDIVVWRNALQHPTTRLLTTSAGISCLLLLVALGIMWTTRRYVDQTWLRVDGHGMAYSTPGLRIETPWEHVSHIDEGQYRHAYCILTTPSATTMSMWTRFLRSTASSYRAVDCRIPLYLFEWSGSPQLRQTIAALAPQVRSRTSRHKTGVS